MSQEFIAISQHGSGNGLLPSCKVVWQHIISTGYDLLFFDDVILHHRPWLVLIQVIFCWGISFFTVAHIHADLT